METNSLPKTQKIEDCTLKEAMPEVFNGLPVQDWPVEQIENLHSPVIDKDGKLFWPKKVIEFVGLEKMPKDRFAIWNCPINGGKKVIPINELVCQRSKIVSSDQDSCLEKYSDSFMKPKMCDMPSEKIDSRIFGLEKHQLGSTCLDDLIHLTKRKPRKCQTEPTWTQKVKINPDAFQNSQNCDSRIKILSGPTFGLDTIYGDIEKRLTLEKMSFLPKVKLKNGVISHQYIQHANFNHFRYEI